MITVTSKRSGLTVRMNESEYAEIMTTSGGQHGAYEDILNCAGRILKHRRTLAAYEAQELTEGQRRQVAAMARAYAIEDAIYAEVQEMGYESYLRRAQMGGLMPESWSRIVSDARSRIDTRDVQVSPYHQEIAMRDLGFLTDGDAEWSRGITKNCSWEITAPAGWGEPHPIMAQ